MLHNGSLEARIGSLNREFEGAAPEEILQFVLEEKGIGQIAMVSSFGAESAVLLHMVAQINPATPVLFVDTEFLFKETISYLKTLAVELGLQDIRRIMPDPLRTATYDREETLHKRDKDQCCHIRKTLPLRTALGDFSGWITGRKRHQSKTRAELNFFELDTVTNRIKVNPLAFSKPLILRAYMDRNNLPAHPLVAQGYPSIGCFPCTSRVLEGEDERAGRWRGEDKDECGIHFDDGKIIRKLDKEIAS